MGAMHPLVVSLIHRLQRQKATQEHLKDVIAINNLLCSRMTPNAITAFLTDACPASESAPKLTSIAMMETREGARAVLDLIGSTKY